MQQPATLAFEQTELLVGKIRLTCSLQLQQTGRVVALAQGIPVGEARVDRKLRPGEVLDIPIRYFPNVALPAKIRFLLEETEISAPCVIPSTEEVMLLVGYGEWSISGLEFENGLLRGKIVNRTNGVAAPQTSIRINNVVVRSVSVEPPVLNDDGGATCRFAVPLRPADFTESGITVDFFFAGLDFPVSNFGYVRTDPTIISRRLTEVEERLRQAQNTSSFQIDSLWTNVERKLTQQQQRIDSFVEYAVSIIFDHVARDSGNLDVAGLAEALREAIPTSTAKKNAPAVARPAQPISAKVPLDSTGFAFGWYDVELAPNHSFRWMARSGILRNPFPNRRIERVTLVVDQVYGAPQPLLRAEIDSQDLAVSAEKHDSLFLITLVPMGGESSTLGHAINLESFASGSPAIDHGTNDSRVLSIAVTEATFYYAADKAE